MKAAMAIVASLVLLFGVGIAMEFSKRNNDEKAIKEYIESRGATRVPRSWSGKIGEGI